jgi:hypothetical protein
LKKLCEFSTVLADRGVFGSTENFVILLKHPTFVVFLCVFSWAKQVQNWSFCNRSNCTKKLINIKVTKRQILALNALF